MLNLKVADDVHRLRSILEQIEDLFGVINTSKLRDLNESLQGSDMTPVGPDDASRILALAKDIYKLRRARAAYLPQELFADPAWDILLELFILRLENRRASVKSVCIAADVPATTALRWINVLLSKKLIERSNDANDQRIKLISITNEGFEAMRQLLAAHGRVNAKPDVFSVSSEPARVKGYGR